MTAQKTLVLFLYLLLVYLPNQLISVDPCVFDLHAKGIIDLTGVGRVDGTPAWKNVKPVKDDQHLYSYNPCRPFTQSACINVAACQTYATDEKLAYSLGTQNSLQWTVAPGKDLPTLHYTTGERTLVVSLHCLSAGGKNKLVVHGLNPTTKLYEMTLSSKCACWDGCKGGHSGNSSNGLSGGTIFIIILLVAAVIYFIAFISFNKFKRQASGVDILPHRTFWVSLPGYSLGGVKFIVHKITGKETNYTPVP
ncbi:unnamed protein product [Rotaria socialis]|uniref:Autophagy-related protein 27 n=1 Tax=Rotaria socialis TaxID=392032 RepID=A0A817VQN9_9BILA|nr:unnamed protein product [Rotaria socialis]CAF4536220.1 unnamed protein product [Rotaria socialis]